MLGAALALPFASGCSRQKADPVTRSEGAVSTSDEAIKRRFRGIRGGELVVDSIFDTAHCLIIVEETGYLFNIGSGVFGPKNQKISAYGGNWPGDHLPMPKHLRLLRFPEDAKFVSHDKPPYYEAPPLIDVTVPVAERIPDSALDAARAGEGGLRLKLRIHPKTLLVGWDIDHGREYSTTARDKTGRLFFPRRYSHIGGDFCERQIWWGKDGLIKAKGWYIDPDTGQRIETDY